MLIVETWTLSLLTMPHCVLTANPIVYSLSTTPLGSVGLTAGFRTCDMSYPVMLHGTTNIGHIRHLPGEHRVTSTMESALPRSQPYPTPHCQS